MCKMRKKIINSYIFMTLIKLIHEKLSESCLNDTINKDQN